MNAAPFNLPFDEAVAFFRAKGITVSPESWRDVWRDANARAFTVARVTQMDVLADLKTAVDAALSQGMSLGEFKASVRPLLERRGWMTPKGEAPTVKLPDGAVRKRLTPWRLENIYRTNLQTAYSAGRWKQQEETAWAFPYLQYMAILDSRTRPSHAAMHGKVFHREHPVWDRWYPPNGFACRCYVKQLTESQVKARGLKVRKEGVDVNPDEGWDYHVGKEGLQAWQPKLDRYPRPLASAFVRQRLESEAFERFVKDKAFEQFQVAVLDEAIRRAIMAETAVVNLSRETLEKNLDHHPEIGLADYRMLPTIIEDAQLVVQDGERTVVFLRVGDKIYYAALKSTQTGQALWLLSLRQARVEEIEAVRRRGKVLRDNL